MTSKIITALVVLVALSGAGCTKSGLQTGTEPMMNEQVSLALPTKTKPVYALDKLRAFNPDAPTSTALQTGKPKTILADTVIFKKGIPVIDHAGCMVEYDTRLTFKGLTYRYDAWTLEVEETGPLNYKVPNIEGLEPASTSTPEAQTVIQYIYEYEPLVFGADPKKPKGAIRAPLGWYIPYFVTQDEVYTVFVQEAC